MVAVKSPFDMRPVYRWNASVGEWVFRCSGRYMRPCPLKFPVS